ncbi:SDR family oxidoreductase [Flexibacterium corallicola]|uniref:SDR family oxidoreductase n=1 Tax=Flexibacterium corallicola TaxID=3037259 RepID=UPI00286EBAD5|nr:SDR family oxidoreductase [Pseudovibrio sp. M1P-2-3]
MILLTGATGTTGKQVVDLLVQNGVQVRALVRDKTRATDLALKGVELVEGSFENIEEMPHLFEGIERAFFLSGISDKQRDYEPRFYDMAKRSGIKHVVKQSAWVAEYPDGGYMAKTHSLGEGYLKASSLTYTIIRPNYFMQNFVDFAPSIKEQGAVFLPVGVGRCGVIDIRDLAEVIAAVLTQEGHENKTYRLTGPDILTIEECCLKLAKGIGRPVHFQDIPLDDFKRTLMSFGQTEWFAERIVELMNMVKEDTQAETTNTVEDVLKRPPRAFDEFVEDYAGNFR